MVTNQEFEKLVDTFWLHINNSVADMAPEARCKAHFEAMKIRRAILDAWEQQQVFYADSHIRVRVDHS